MDHAVIRILKSVKAAVSKNGIIAISAYRKKNSKYYHLILARDNCTKKNQCYPKRRHVNTLRN